MRVRTALTLYGTPLYLPPPSVALGEFDVIHANFPSPYLAAASAVLGAARRTPRVLTWHNDLPPVSSAARILVSVHSAASPSYLRLYQRIVATTPQYAAASPVLRRFRARVAVIPNGVDTTRFKPGLDGSRVRARHDLDGCVVALFVGALTKWHGYKGLDVLIRAMRPAGSSNPRLRLLVVGDGELRERYQRLALEEGIGGVVRFAGHVPDAELPSYYAACDFSVLPSRDFSEGFGLTILEAMASGKPVIGSAVGGIPGVITDGVDGVLVEPGEPAKLAAAISNLSRAGGLADMGRAARRRAEACDWDKTVDSLERLYGDVAGAG